jgi:hypothetical protein
MRLPPALEPWSPWLTLFPEDLMQAIGSLLLRLHPLVGHLRTSVDEAKAEPIGVGDIRRKGSYERLLMSEWAIADEIPDEFIRRAAGNELLFMAPEWGGKLNSRISLALFDAGPWQAGSPRLAHIALLILLARRAEMADAEFRWGVLQKPATLHTDTGRAGLQELLRNRFLALPTEDERNAWHDRLREQDLALADKWQIVGADDIALDQPGSKVVIGADLLTPSLNVTVAKGSALRRATLDLPSPDLGVRILRQPFAPLAPNRSTAPHEAQFALTQPPRFSVNGQWIVIPLLDGDIASYHIPTRLREKSGKPRIIKPVKQLSALGVTVFNKGVARLLSGSDGLHFIGFPGAFFSRNVRVERPPQPAFLAPIGAARWLQIFHQTFSDAHSHALRERVLALDAGQQLVSWVAASVHSKAGSARVTPVDFSVVASNVIAAQQDRHTVWYASVEGHETKVLQWEPGSDVGRALSIPFSGTRLVWSRANDWRKERICALQVADTSWMIGTQTKWRQLDVPASAVVLGVLACEGDDHHLIALSPSKKEIQLIGAGGAKTAISSPKKIAQAAFDFATGRVGWITADRDLIVQGVTEVEPILHVVSRLDE